MGVRRLGPKLGVTRGREREEPGYGKYQMKTKKDGDFKLSENVRDVVLKLELKRWPILLNPKS